VSFARLYALRHDIRVTNTFGRVDALVAAGRLASSTRDDVTFAADQLLRWRLEHQSRQAAQGLPMDNAIDHRGFSHMQTVLLREAFEQVDIIQQKIAGEFLGGRG
jgi:CBS domain-containing protein